jgi:prepilin-type N-terminal cleavage/methylation domain-containing protein
MFRLSSSEFVRAFALIELLVVLTIIGILSIISFVSLSELSKANVLDVATGDIVSVLSEARSRTLSSEGDSVYGVHFETNSITLFKGDTFNAIDPNNVDIPLSSAVTISAITLTGGATEVVFGRISGDADVTGTITIALSTDATDTKTITIPSTGVVSVN